jgi:hypothetical protein
MKPVLFPVAPAQKSAQLIRPALQLEVSKSLSRPSFQDLASSKLATSTLGQAANRG